MNRTPLNNKTIQLGNIEWNIQEEIARGSSIIAYKVFNEKFGVAILKEYYPIELELDREEARIVCEDDSWEEYKYQFSRKMDHFIHVLKNNLVDKMIYNNLPNTIIYEKEDSTNNTVYILQNYSYGSIYSNVKEGTLLELFENILSISNIVKDFHEQGYILFDLKPSNLYVVTAVDQQYFNLIDFDSITKKDEIDEKTYIKCTHDYHDDTPIHEINEKYDIYSLGKIVQERIVNYDFNLVHSKVKTLVDELIEKSCCKQESRYNDTEFINKVHEILEYLQIKYFLTSMTLYEKDFYGYQNEIDKIHTYLNKDKFACLYGLNGIGKSSIAYEYAYQYQDNYKIIQIVDFKNDWLETFKSFQCNHELESLSYNFMFSLLSQCENSLFIINDYVFNEENNRILDLLRKTNVHILLTSNEGNIHVQGLDEESALSLFKHVYGQEIKDSDLSSIYKLMKDVHYHPGMIELCVNAIKQINATFFQSPIKIFMSKVHKDIMIQVNHHFDSFQNHLHKLLNLQGFNDNEKECLYLLQFADEIGISEKFVIKYGISNESIHSLLNQHVIQRSNGMIRINSLFNSELIRKCLNLNTYVSEQLYNALNNLYEPNLRCSMIYNMSIVDPLFNKVLNAFINKDVLVYTNTYILEKTYQYILEVKEQVNLKINCKQIENELLKRQNKIDEIVVRIQNDVDQNVYHSINLEKINSLRKKAKTESNKGNLYQAIQYYLQADKLLTYYPLGYIDIIEDCFNICDICFEIKSFSQGIFYATKAMQLFMEKDRNNNKLGIRCILNTAKIYNIYFYIADAFTIALKVFDLKNLDSNDVETTLHFIEQCFYIYANPINGTDEDDYSILYHLILKIVNIREKLKLNTNLDLYEEYEIHFSYISAMFSAGRVIEAIDYSKCILNGDFHITERARKDLNIILNSILILCIRGYSEIRPKKQEIINLINYLENEHAVNELRVSRAKINYLSEIYAYLLYTYPECNTIENRNKAIQYLKLSIYFYANANPIKYKKEINYLTFLLNNIGVDYYPFEIEKNVKCKDKEGLLMLVDIVNRKSDEIMKLY